MSEQTEKFNFSWGKTMEYGFLVGGVSFLCVSAAVYFVLPTLRLASLVLFLVSLNLLAGDAAIRYVNKMTHELVLPFVDLFSSDHDQVLDVGCGHGRTSIAISKVMKNCQITALDRFDASYVEDGKAALESNLKIAQIQDKVKIVTGDVTKLEFEDNTFDSAVSSYMMDHLGEQREVALQEVQRVLKPGGKFLLVVIVRNYFTFAVASFLSLAAMPSKKNWRALFPQAGFKLVEEGEINGGAYFLLEKT